MIKAKYLLKQVKIIDPRSSFNQKVVDVILEDGKVLEIAPKLDAEQAQVIEGENLHLSLGFVELKANFNDPGNEDRENLQSGCKAALQGGYTAVALSPETNPCVDSKASVEYLKAFGAQSPVHILPLASFSKGLQGKELSELYDLQEAGAIAFSHGTKALSNSALMRLALLYNRELEKPLQILSFDESMTAGGQMHEGAKSTWLGLKGIPDLSETISMSRDIALAEYTESALHFNGISSAAGLEILQNAQKKGLPISADVHLMNLLYTDEDLDSYDSHLKVFPPLRSKSDREALIAGLKDGSLKAISGDHRPRTIEEKRCEFDLAKFGAASLEGSFAALNSKLQDELGLEKIIDLLCYGSRDLLGFQSDMSIEIAKEVDLCLYNPDKVWEWGSYHPKSKAANYPFSGQQLKGEIIGTYSKGIWSYREA